MRAKNNVVLNDGHQMPTIGFGTWLTNEPESLEKLLNSALEAGYRHFDTAYFYQNEDILGDVLKKWFDSGRVKREDLFIVSKLPMIAMWPYRVNEFLKKSLKALQLDYVDLYMIQFPIGLKHDENDVIPKDEDGKVILDTKTHLEATWKAMEHEVRSGRTKSVGLSNFNQEQIERILQSCTIPPVNLQVEVNAYFQQKELRAFCKKHNIVVCAYSPLGFCSEENTIEKANVTTLMEDATIRKIAKKHGKTEAQVLLRFLIQSDLVVIPRTTNPERVKSNFEIFGFDLDSEDLTEINRLDKGKVGHSKRAFFKRLLSGAEEHPEFPWKD
jgi:diketogulonate reductase-like aldo/keto reductase